MLNKNRIAAIAKKNETINKVIREKEKLKAEEEAAKLMKVSCHYHYVIHNYDGGSVDHEHSFVRTLEKDWFVQKNDDDPTLYGKAELAEVLKRDALGFALAQKRKKIAPFNAKFIEISAIGVHAPVDLRAAIDQKNLRVSPEIYMALSREDKIGLQRKVITHSFEVELIPGTIETLEKKLVLEAQETSAKRLELENALMTWLALQKMAAQKLLSQGEI